MENMPKPTERAPEDEKFDDPVMTSMHEQNVFGEGAPEQNAVPYPEVEGSVDGEVKTGLDENLEAKANEILNQDNLEVEGPDEIQKVPEEGDVTTPEQAM